MTLKLERLENRECPAILDITNNIINYIANNNITNSITISISGSIYTFNDSSETIIITGDTTNWTGSGTNTVTGPDSSINSIYIDTKNNNDIVNIRSTNDDIIIIDEDGNDITNISSNAPNNTGTLNNINSNITINGGSGNDSLVVSDFSAYTENDSILVDESSIINLAPGNINYNGTFQKIRILTSNTPGLNENIIVENNSSLTQIDTFSGKDIVSVKEVSFPIIINTGHGNDEVILGNNGLLNGLLGTITIDEGSGNNSLIIDDSNGGSHDVVVTNNQIQNFAPVNINYKSLGGTLLIDLICGSTSTIDILPHSTLYEFILTGNWIEI